MTRQVVNKSPTRKTLVTGESLPAITTDSRPIPLGRDEDGEPDAQVRAFAVLARNRSDSPVYVREGTTDDENVIDAGESFQIWEPNGINNVQVRGENGGERVEFRTLEAHNDFSITDKIDAFSRALSHFFGTSRRSTTIEGDVDIGTFADTVTVDSIQSGTVDIGTFSDTVTIDDIQAGTIDANVTNGSLTVDSVTGGIDANVSGSVDIGQFSDTITIDDIQAGEIDANILNSTLTVDSVAGGLDANVSGNVGIADANGDVLDIDADGNLVVGDIRATSANFDGDITGQTNFDLSAAVREGQDEITTLSDTNLSEGTDPGFGVQLDFHSYEIYAPSAYDGQVKRVQFRIFDYTDPATAGFKVGIDRGSTGSYDFVSPASCATGRLARRYGGDEVKTPRFYPNGEVVIIWEPSSPVRFNEGDSVGVEVAAYNNNNLSDTATYDVEMEIITTQIVTQ